MENDGNTEVLVEEMEVWRRLLWTREVCEKDGLWIKRSIARRFVRKLTGPVSRVGRCLGRHISR